MRRTDKLPTRFLILRDELNPLWDKYIKWINNNYCTKEDECHGLYNGYYGLEGTALRIIQTHQNERAHYAQLTLEEWNDIVYPEQDSPYQVSYVADKASGNPILKEAVEKWGKDRQLDKIIEEASELTKAILKLRHADKDNINPIHALQDLAEEHADLLLTLGYLPVIFGVEYANDVHNRMNFKLEALKHKLTNP